MPGSTDGHPGRPEAVVRGASSVRTIDPRRDVDRHGERAPRTSGSRNPRRRDGDGLPASIRMSGRRLGSQMTTSSAEARCHPPRQRRAAREAVGLLLDTPSSQIPEVRLRRSRDPTVHPMSGDLPSGPVPPSPRRDVAMHHRGRWRSPDLGRPRAGRPYRPRWRCRFSPRAPTPEKNSENRLRAPPAPHRCIREAARVRAPGASSPPSPPATGCTAAQQLLHSSPAITRDARGFVSGRARR